MAKNKSVLCNIFYTFVKILLFILLMIALLNMIIIKDNIEWNFNYSMIYSILIIDILLIYFIMGYYSKKKNNDSKVKKIIKSVLLLIAFGVQLVYAILIRRNIGFDCGVLYGSAIDLINGTFSNSEYFSMYGNNIFLLLIYEIIFRFVKFFGIENYLVVQIIVNVIMIDITLVYIYKICKIMFGEKYSKICNFISMLMIGVTPYISVVYSDTFSLIFPIAIFYNYLCVKQLNGYNISVKKRIVYITMLTIIGCLIKPTNLIILIAIIIVEFIGWIQSLILNMKNSNKSYKINYKKYIGYTMCMILTAIFVYGGFNIYKSIRLRNYISKEQIENNSFPMTHFFMMGLKPQNVEGKYYGFYSEEDVQATKSHIGVESKKEFNIYEAKNRLKAMKIGGYISYLYDKYTWIISDGTFFYGKEGNFYTSDAYSNGKIAKFIQNYAYCNKEGYINVTINVMQSIWIISLVFCVIDICINFVNERSSNINVLRLSIIGIILFILLFEARSRYLINYLPIIVILATSGIINLYKFIKKENVNLIEDK